ncbi:hypothetical protein A2U01_0041292, partial [Trifolium medium]|nr:hypothetical protein [Trifolium medium]
EVPSQEMMLETRGVLFCCIIDAKQFFDQDLYILHVGFS